MKTRDAIEAADPGGEAAGAPAAVAPGAESAARIVRAPGPGGRRLTAELWVPAPPERTFAFFSNPANLETITPPFLRFTILTRPPVAMRVGTLIEYRLRLLGVPIRWITRIAEWRPGRGFTDVQLRGPYARWIHRHAFVPAAGGTRVRDEVDYALPLAPLSDPVHALLVRPWLARIFDYRRAAIARILGAA